jgi:HK97 family phage portal protein
MGLLQRIRDRWAPERRDMAFAALSPALGEAYHEIGSYRGEAVAAVSASVRLVSGTLSACPPLLVADGPDGQQAVPPGALAWRLLRRPSPRHSWPAWMSWTVRSLLLDGNALLWIQTDGRGAITALTPIPWLWVTPGYANGGRLVFDIWAASNPEAEALGLPKRLVEDEVLHIRGQSDVGLIGQSVLSRARGPAREGAEIEKLALSNWKNGMRPSGVLSAPTFLTDAQRARFGAGFINEFTGALAAGRVPLLEGGWKLETAALSSVDAEFLSSRQ